MQFSLTATSQSFFDESDSLNKDRFYASTGAIAGVWTGSMIGLSQIWYKDVEKSPWHTFDDSKNWMQMDKIGHVYTANKISLLTGNLFRWSGVKNKRAAWAGFGIGLGYQTTLEMFDAYSKEWGFSWSDFGANLIGSSSYLGQQLAWQEQRIHLKYSVHLSPYAKYRPEVLGATSMERILKDYNGQTYWLSISPGKFMKNNSFPDWLCFSIGYSVDQKLVGDQDFYVDYSYGAHQFTAKRQYLFSLDIDFSSLPIKRPWLKAIVRQFNYLKIPFPTIELSDGIVRGHWVYF